VEPERTSNNYIARTGPQADRIKAFGADYDVWEDRMEEFLSEFHDIFDVFFYLSGG
jgi:hypothetical protein